MNTQETFLAIQDMERRRAEREARNVSQADPKPFASGPSPDQVNRVLGVGQYRQGNGGNGHEKSKQYPSNEQIEILGVIINPHYLFDKIVDYLDTNYILSVLAKKDRISHFERVLD